MGQLRSLMAQYSGIEVKIIILPFFILSIYFFKEQLITFGFIPIYIYIRIQSNFQHAGSNPCAEKEKIKTIPNGHFRTYVVSNFCFKNQANHVFILI